jgi:hypothetical protein
MATFYFHIDDGADETLDKIGVELPDLKSAQVEAAVLAGELLRDRPDEFWGVQSWTMTVQDESGLTLLTIHIAATTSPAMLQQAKG